MKYSHFNGKKGMRLLKTDELEESWKNLIYPPKQLGRTSLDLTVKNLSTIKTQSKGVLDFGGSEYQPLELIPLEAKIEKDPKYGWWTLSKGHYMVEYNETLCQGKFLALIYPHKRLQMTGCFHAPFIVVSSTDTQKIQGLLNVNSEGVRIKENARISIAITFFVE